MKTTGNVNHNHCAKADPNDPLPFCYTTDPNVRYEHCNCEDSSNDGDYSFYQDNDDQYKNYGGGAYGVNNGYNQYGQYGGANVGYDYAPGSVNYPSNSGYHPRAINPINPFGSGGQQDCARVSTTIKGIVYLQFVISGQESDRFQWNRSIAAIFVSFH